MKVFMKYNIHSEYGTTWNISNLSLVDIYAIFSSPRNMVVFPSKKTKPYFSNDVDDFKSYLSFMEDYDRCGESDFYCADYNCTDMALTKEDIDSMVGFYDDVERLDHKFLSLDNTFVWYSHDGGAFTAISFLEEYPYFLFNCLQHLNKLSSCKKNIVFDKNIMGEIFENAKNGICIDSKDIIHDENTCSFEFECCSDDVEFSDLISDKQKNFIKKRFTFNSCAPIYVSNTKSTYNEH